MGGRAGKAGVEKGREPRPMRSADLIISISVISITIIIIIIISSSLTIIIIVLLQTSIEDFDVIEDFPEPSGRPKVAVVVIIITVIV